MHMYVEGNRDLWIRKA